MTETLEHTARRIADHGREALLARLRPAFAEAAAVRRDVLTLDDEQLEQMVQRAAEKADGLQWRRALASVATDQLGIGLGEALHHPAVAQAQTILGVPSYEEALDTLRAKSASAPKPDQDGPDAGPEAVHAGPEAPHAGPEAVHAEPPQADEVPEDLEDEQDEQDEQEDEEDEEEEEEDVQDEEPDDARSAGSLRLHAVHLGGIANLSPAQGDLELHFSDVGMDILRGPDHSPIGRLTWSEISAVEVPAPPGRLTRRRKGDAHLVIRSEQGSASFEIPGVSADELREHLGPLLKHR